MSFLESPKAKHTPSGIVIITGCLLVCPLLLTIALAMIYFSSEANQIGMSPIAIGLVGLSTPYPTQTPYSTATPYFTATPYNTPTPFKTPTPAKTATVYPTVAHYPTTGALGRQLFLPVGTCQLTVENQYTIQDAVIILADVDTNAIGAAVYARARDSHTYRGVQLGTYYTYVALGQDWDSVTSRFKNNAAYFRAEEPNTFSPCGYSVFQKYYSLKVTLNNKQGSGTSTLFVDPDSFPSIAQRILPGFAP